VPDCDVACEFRTGPSEGADAIWHAHSCNAHSMRTNALALTRSRTRCRFVRARRYHAPSGCNAPAERAFPDQVAIVMSMEARSAATKH
jgi:hypothetical protein